MDYNEFWDLLTGFRKSRIVHTALQHRFFNYIDEGADAPTIAHKAKTHPDGTERILNALVAMGILDKLNNRYVHTELSRNFLVEREDNSELSGVIHAIQSWENWGQLPDIVKTGELPERKRVFDEPDRYRTFILAMHEYQKHRAPDFVQHLPVENGDAILDCGGGPGTYARAFARRYPESAVTLFDLPDAIEIAKELDTDDVPVHYIAGDFFKSDLGGPYDFIFLSNIVHSHSPKRNRTLFGRLFQALNSSGKLVIRDRFLDESGTEPLGSVIFGLHMYVNNLEGKSYTVGEMRKMLQSTGFEEVEYHSIAEESEIVIAMKV